MNSCSALCAMSRDAHCRLNGRVWNLEAPARTGAGGMTACHLIAASFFRSMRLIHSCNSPGS